MLPVAILAGGLATRLRPMTETIPKALIDVNGEPFLAHQLRLLKRAGATRVVLCVGYRGEMIRDFAGDGRRFGLEVAYSFDGARLLGTGGAIRRALPLLGEAFFVLYGDSYLPCDYRDVERGFLQAGKLALMTVFRNQGRWDDSNIEFSDGRVVRYDKRDRTPEMQHIDYGLGAFRSSVFEALPIDEVHDLAAIYQQLLRRDQLAGYEVQERFYEIGSWEGIGELKEYLETAKRRAVFLDRDGVLNVTLVRDGRPYPPTSPEELRIVPSAAVELRRLRDAGFLLIVVTNQPDVGRGTQTRQVVEELNAAVGAALPVDDFYVCFHDGAEGCGCRKPKPGLLVQAAGDRNIDLQRSFLIGDRWRDIDAGAAAGCRTVLIDYHYNERGPENAPDYRAGDLSDAVQWILGAKTL
jgi:N-acetyl-alpha-D-muramate 1-phosphate uridylyltransferase